MEKLQNRKPSIIEGYDRKKMDCFARLFSGRRVIINVTVANIKTPDIKESYVINVVLKSPGHQYEEKEWAI
jgi:hypothetical protein